MLGAIIGDLIGSPYEFGASKSKDFPLFVPECKPTDDSILTIAVGCACISSDLDYELDFKIKLEKELRAYTLKYPNAGYGDRFYRWVLNCHAWAYGSCGNGSAMRVSPIAWVANSLEKAEQLAKWSAEITHNHPDGIKGAQAVAAAIFMARTGATKEEIRGYISGYYDLNFSIEDIRPEYKYSMICKYSVPQAIVSFLDAIDFEDAIRNAISLGGDGDTQAAIAGSIAEAYYGIPKELKDKTRTYLDSNLYQDVLKCTQILYQK